MHMSSKGLIIEDGDINRLPEDATQENGNDNSGAGRMDGDSVDRRRVAMNDE